MKKHAVNINKSQFIRDFGDVPAADVVEAGAKQGLSFSDKYVHHIRAAARKKPKRQHKIKKTSVMARMTSKVFEVKKPKIKKLEPDVFTADDLEAIKSTNGHAKKSETMKLDLQLIVPKGITLLEYNDLIQTLAKTPGVLDIHSSAIPRA